VRFNIQLVDEWWTVVKRSATTYVASALGFLVGALSSTYLAAFAVIGFIPAPWLQLPLAGLVGAIVIGGPIILSRIVAQPKMTEKIAAKQEASDAQPE